MRRAKLTPDQLAVRRQLAFGVLYECQRAGFGQAPRPRSAWASLAQLAPLASWLLGAVVVYGVIVLASAH